MASVWRQTRMMNENEEEVRLRGTSAFFLELDIRKRGRKRRRFNSAMIMDFTNFSLYWAFCRAILYLKSGKLLCEATHKYLLYNNFLIIKILIHLRRSLVTLNSWENHECRRMKIAHFSTLIRCRVSNRRLTRSESDNLSACINSTSVRRLSVPSSS